MASIIIENTLAILETNYQKSKHQYYFFERASRLARHDCINHDFEIPFLFSQIERVLFYYHYEDFLSTNTNQLKRQL